MITANDILPLFSELDVRFKVAADGFRKEWENDNYTGQEGLPHYLYLDEVAHIVINDFELDRKTELRRVFQLIDRMIIEGEHYVSEAAVVGLLEGIQNLLKQRGFLLDKAYPFLLRESRYQWDDLLRFWGEIDEGKKDVKLLAPRSQKSSKKKGKRKKR